MNKKINIEANYFVPAAEPPQLVACPSSHQRCGIAMTVPVPVPVLEFSQELVSPQVTAAHIPAVVLGEGPPAILWASL